MPHERPLLSVAADANALPHHKDSDLGSWNAQITSWGKSSTRSGTDDGNDHGEAIMERPRSSSLLRKRQIRLPSSLLMRHVRHSS